MQPGLTAAMSILVEDGLISGKTIQVEAGLHESVGSLKCRAQTALAVGNGRLVDSSARWLDEERTIKEAKLHTGTLLTLQVASAFLVKAVQQPWVTDPLLVGETISATATVVLCKISCKVCSRSKPLCRLLQLSCLTDPSLLGETIATVVTVVLCKIS